MSLDRQAGLVCGPGGSRRRERPGRSFGSVGSVPAFGDVIHAGLHSGWHPPSRERPAACAPGGVAGRRERSGRDV